MSKETNDYLKEISDKLTKIYYQLSVILITLGFVIGYLLNHSHAN